MNKLKILTLATTAAGFLSLSAQAASDTYFGIGIVQSKASDSDSVSVGSVTISENTKYKKINYKVLMGSRLNNNWAIEGQYTNFARDTGIINITNSENAAINGDWTATYSGSSLGVAGLYYFTPQANFSPFVKLGWHFWDTKGQLAKGAVSFPVLDRDGNNEFYGVGVDGKINETMKYRVEFERMKIKDDTDSNNVDNIGVGLLFDF